MLLPPLLLAAALSAMQLNPIALTLECSSIAGKEYSGHKSWSYINAGGTGTVYGSTDGSAVLKVARRNSENRVANECEMINFVNKNIDNNYKYKGLKFVKCLDQCSVIGNSKDDSDMGILMSPLIPPNYVSSFDSMLTGVQDNDIIIKKAINNLLRILDLLLNIDVVVSDLQLLISPATGEVYLIDLTESYVIDKSPRGVGLELVLRHESKDLVFRRTDWPASRFNLISEVVASIPTKYHQYMVEVMRNSYSDNEAMKEYVSNTY